MISGCFINVLCITMEQRLSWIKPEGRDEPGPAKHGICFIYGGEYQTAVSAVRWSRGYIRGLCRGQWGGLPPAECFYEVLLLAVVLYGKLKLKDTELLWKKSLNCGETIISCFSLDVFVERIAPCDSNWFWSVTWHHIHRRINTIHHSWCYWCWFLWWRHHINITWKTEIMSDWATLHVALHTINNFKPINTATEQSSVIFRVSWYIATAKHELHPLKWKSEQWGIYEKLLAGLDGPI